MNYSPQEPRRRTFRVGACLISGGETVARVMQLLRGGAFYHQAHQVIFDAMKALHGCGRPLIWSPSRMRWIGRIGWIGWVAPPR